MVKEFPEIKTERLVLRALHLNDAEALFELRYHDEVIKYIAREKSNNKDNVIQFITDRNNDVSTGKIVFWGIQKKGVSKVIGTICLWNFNADKTNAEVGCELHPEHHNKGFMTEALQVVLNYGFATLKLKAIEAFTDKDNLNSKLLLKKLQFKYDANRVDDGYPNNRIYIKTND